MGGGEDPILGDREARIASVGSPHRRLWKNRIIGEGRPDCRWWT